GRLTLSGDADAPAIEGDFSPKELLLELPEVGLSTVKSGSLDLGPGQALCRDLVVETKYGLFGVQGSVRGPLMDPTVSLRADCASFDLVPILEKRKLPATMEGGCSAVIGLEGKAKRPSVRAELDVRGLALDWPSEKIGGIPIRVVLAKVQYSGDALRAKDADVTVWKVPATAGIQIEGLSGSMRLAAEARAADVDLGRLAKNLPAPIRKALEQYRVQGRTAVTAEVAGSREDTTVVLDAPGAGLSLAVPLGTESLAVTLQGGRVTLARQTLYGSRLTGLVNGTPFAGDVAVTNLIDQPGVKGEVMLRRARLDKLVPAVASRYDVRGTPDLRVVLSESKETPYEVSAPAGGLSMSLAVEGGTKLPLAFEAGELRLAAGSLQGRRLAGALAGGSFHGELTVQSALSGTPRPVGKASLQRVWIEKLLPELARSYSVEGPIDADVTFDGSRVGLSCSLAGMRTRVPAGKSFVTLEFEGGRIDLADGGARMSKVTLTLGGKGTIRLDGDATRGRMDLGLTAQGLEVGRLISAATGGESRSKRPLAFDGRIRTVHQSPLLTGRFVLGAEPAPATTASKLLDGSSGELSWDGTILKTQKLKVLGVPATLEMVRAPDGSRLNFEMKNAALETILEKSGAWAGIASGSADASFVIRSSQSDEGGFSGSGHVVIRQLIVRGEKVAKAAGIQNPSTKLRGAGGFLSLGFLPSFLSLPGQVAAGQLHMNAAYVDFAFADHDLGNLRWDAQLKGGRMAGPLSTSPDASHVSGHLALDLRQAFAEGSFGIADSNKGISMKVNPLLLDTRRSPPMWTPGGLKDFEFAGAGDAFNIVGTAGSAVLGGILRGGSAALGPASLVPMLFLGDKKPHRPYTGKPGERPSSAEATVRTTAEMLDRPRK
ncbi:MAG: hypothetical protein HYY25_08570, partial [Candidatus Wallbacteria bacterium]|nr:hypothetical protein [Candidatus Wallbacteria bacterium]